jgi:hypothetical protein
VRNVPGDRIEFTAVTTPHWRGRPHFKDLTILLVPEESTRVADGAHRRGGDRLDRPETMLGAARAGLEILAVPGHHAGGLPVLGHLAARGEGFADRQAAGCARRCRWRSTASR